MRYTERKFDYNFGTVYDFVRMIFILIFIAPARLCCEVSSKIIYLKRKQIVLVLDVAFILMFLIIAIVALINNINGSFSITLGKFPVVIQFISLVLLGTLNLSFRFFDFVIYKQLDKMLPILTGANMEFNEKAESVEESKTNSDEDMESSLNDVLSDLDLSTLEEQLNKVTSEEDSTIDSAEDDISSDMLDNNTIEPINLDSYDLDSLLNVDLADNSEIDDYQNQNESIVKDLLSNGFGGSTNLSEEEIKTIEANLDDSTDTSKYLDDSILNMFAGKVGVDNFGTIETFNDWGVPNNFSMLT